MGRAFVVVVVLMLSLGASADEVVVAKVLPHSDAVTRLSIDRGGGSVVRRASGGPGILVIATKRASNRATIDALRVSYSVDEKQHASLQVGENVDGVWRPVPAGAFVDLTVYVPARLLPAWESHPGDEQDDGAPLLEDDRGAMLDAQPRSLVERHP